ncbi:MAG: hypothetical protein IJ189_13375 [Clostridia bacterium]|nr:hypothetical protein [Clostridia bacterium]
MKKFCLILTLMLALTVSAARAEVVGYAGDDGYIHRYACPNGQELYFVSTLQEPYIEFTDLNGDGTADMTVVTALGASNAWYEFFIWDGDQYVMAQHSEPIINYSIQDGYIYSRSNNGMAGAMFDACLLRWEGTELRPVRVMKSEEKSETTWQENQITTTSWLDICRVRLWNCVQQDEYQERALLWEKEFAPDDLAIYDEMDAQLWRGLK